MKRVNNISPTIDLTSSREYYGMYNSRDFYKGTSFKMSGEWCPNTHYFNDEYIVDFVSFQGALLSCIRSHLSTSAGADVPQLIINEDKIIGIKPNPCWAFVMSGTEGPEGKAWVPKISSDGTLTWSKEDITPASAFNIKGEKGDVGRTPAISVINQNGNYYWTVDGKIILDSSNNPVLAQGPRGEKGDSGKVYIPKIEGKNMVFTLSDISNPTITANFDEFRGEDGKTPIFTLSDTGYLGYHYGDGNIKSLGNISGPQGPQGKKGNIGDRGPKGDQGNPGPAPRLQIRYNASTGQAVLNYRTDDVSPWKELGEVGGVPGKSPKLIKVLGDASDPDTQDATKRNDRILWGYDGVPVSEWTTLCYLDELRGDQNIVIGPPYDLNGYYGEYDKYGGPEDHDMIWYDPSDEVIGEWKSSDFLYHAYTELGGDLSKEEFESIFRNLNGIKGFEVIFKEELPEPSKEFEGILVITPKSTEKTSDMFDEWVVVEIEEEYHWEKWGTGSINLEDYYTKEYIDNNFYNKNQIDVKLEALIKSSVWQTI